MAAASSAIASDDRQAPEKRREDEQEQRQAGTEGRHRVLDAVGPTADVEEDDGRERHQAELALREPDRPAVTSGRRRSARAAPSATRRAGGWPRPMISSLPLGRRRTRPGVAGTERDHQHLAVDAEGVGHLEDRVDLLHASTTSSTDAHLVAPPRGSGATSRRRSVTPAARRSRSSRASGSPGIKISLAPGGQRRGDAPTRAARPPARGSPPAAEARRVEADRSSVPLRNSRRRARPRRRPTGCRRGSRRRSTGRSPCGRPR